MSKKARYARYLILLLILFLVAAYQAYQKLRVASWDQTLRVGIYSVNGDSSSATNDYIKSLSLKHFKTISRFVNHEATRHGLKKQATEIEYLSELTDKPPQPPNGNSLFVNIIWSLHFRFWALYWSLNVSSDVPDVNLFVKVIGNFYHLVANGSPDADGIWQDQTVDLMKLYSDVGGLGQNPRLTKLGIFCDSDNGGGSSVAYFGDVILSRP